MESENIIKRSQSIINQKSCKYIPDVSIIVPIYNVEKYLTHIAATRHVTP